MNYCIVRLGKGHLQPFASWSLIPKPSIALTPPGHTGRHEDSTSHLPTQAPSQSQCQPPSLPSTRSLHTVGNGEWKLVTMH